METTNTVKAVAEIADDVEVAKQLASAIKSKDRAAVLSLLPKVASELREDYAAIAAALPEIKPGYKTTEFWLTAGLLAANAVYVAVKGVALTFDVNGTLSALIAIYAVVRGLAKKA